MPSMRGRMNLTPEQREKNRASNQAHADFWKLPGEGRSATTTGPSVRNAVYNIKSLPGDFATVGKKIGSGLRHAVQNIKNPAPVRGRFGRGRGPMNNALQKKAGGAATSTPASK